MHRLFSLVVPFVVASSDAIPTLPTLFPAEPSTTGIVATDDGTVYFADSFNRMVWRVEPSTGLTAFVNDRNGRALELDASGNVYGTHEDGSGRVTLWKADVAGNVSDVRHGDVPSYGHAFVIDGGTGDVFATTGTGRRSGVRVWRASNHEQRLVAGGESGFRDGPGHQARFHPIGGMTMTGAGDLLVTSGQAIRRIAADGTVTTIADTERLLRPRSSLLSWLFGDANGHLLGIAIGAHGEIYVANTARDAVVRIRPDGTADEVVTCDDGWTPTGVATANGFLYVLEYGRGVRVRRVDTSGNVTVLAVVRSDRWLASSLTMGRSAARG